MFAVPGWSVAADGLKPEKLAAQNKPGDKSKKRKRPEAPVNADNLEDMWERVIEGKKPGQAKKGEEGGSKRRKKGKKEGGAEVVSEGQKKEEVSEKTGEEAGEPSKKKKTKKDKKKEKKANEKNAEDTTAPDTKAPSTSKPPAPAPAVAAPVKLTPLQAAMRAKLVPARFRHLNETLYTRPSEEAFRLFRDSPEMFDEYHAGFRQQVNVWPENPVDGYVEAVRTRGAVAPPRDNWRDKRGKGKPQAASADVVPLPRTKGVCTIADLGCGDARLATVLEPQGKKLGLKVLSYDLQSPHPLVTRADIASLPLPDASVNVAVFCLALMGTNWLSFIEEAHRVLHWKGELWIAEIKSRFGRKRQGPVAHSVGNRKKPGAKGAKLGPDFGQDLAVEVDGQDDSRNETDVGAFVEALGKRGFVLRGEGTSGISDAVDLSNRMFVKMYFIKGAVPTVGKGASEETKGRRVFGKKKDEDEEGDEMDEGAILKPCVYKLR